MKTKTSKCTQSRATQIETIASAWDEWWATRSENQKRFTWFLAYFIGRLDGDNFIRVWMDGDLIKVGRTEDTPCDGMLSEVCSFQRERPRTGRSDGELPGLEDGTGANGVWAHQAKVRES